MTLPPLRWSGPDALRERAGQCYTLAGQFVVDNPHYGNWLFLAHGLLHPDRAEGAADWHEKHPDVPVPPTNPHAWVEIDADDGVLAIDPVLRMCWPREEHARLFGVETIRRYRADVAREVMARRASFGPWDRRSVAAWSERQRQAAADPRFSMAAAVERHLDTAR